MGEGGDGSLEGEGRGEEVRGVYGGREGQGGGRGGGGDGKGV